MKKLVLIDSHALIHRAFHALPPSMTSAKGQLTNAVYGFTSVLLKMLSELKPDYVAAAFDLAGPTFRHQEFEDYKATRAKAPDELYAQIPLVRDVLSSFGIPIFEKEGYEADDIIGSIAEQAKTEKDLQVVIMTGDLDTLQLVDGDRVVVFTLRKGVTDTITYNEKEVKKRYGLKPTQVTDFKGLKGDPSDNIPGVPGIGEKTASALIQTFGNIESLYEKISNDQFLISKKDTKKLKPPLSDKLVQKLLENKDMAVFSKRLATIVCDLDIDFTLTVAQWRNHLDQNRIETVFRDLGFYSLLKRLPDVLTVPLAGLTVDFGQPANTAKTTTAPTDFKPTGTWAVQLNQPADGLSFLVLTDQKGEAFRVDLPNNVVPVGLFEHLDLLVGHDLKPLMKLMGEQRASFPQRWFDTRIAAYLLQPDASDYDFAKLFYESCGRVSDTEPPPPSQILELQTVLWDKLKASKLTSVFEDIEMPLVPVLADMERRGILINVSGVKKLSTTLTGEIARLEKEIYVLAGEPFNINSPAQLGNVLYSVLNIKAKIRKTGGGALSTAASELEKIRDSHPIVEKVLEYRELQKLKTTYIDPLPSLLGSDQRIHTTYNQAGAGTGRLASQNPNLQNIPTRTELGKQFRAAFIAEKGFSLVTFDYSQLELRLVAHIAGDEKMIDAFRKGEDIHNRTAVEIFKIPVEKVNKDIRRQAKALNFGLIYGMGVLGFARAAGVDRETAHQFIDRYFAEFCGVAHYMEITKQQAARDGFVQTIFGRRRPLPDASSSMPQLRAQAERMAINHPVQGSEADLIKMAMNKIESQLLGDNMRERVRMLLQVHDELVFEIENALVKKYVPVIKKMMESVHAFSVPIVVDVSVGDNWADVKPYKSS